MLKLRLLGRPATMLIGIALASALVPQARTSLAAPASQPSSAPVSADQKEADEIIAAAERAGQNAKGLAKAIQAGDVAAARAFIGKEVNIGGKPIKRAADTWTIACPWGISVVATKFKEKYDLTSPLEGDVCSAWGALKEVDIAAKTVTLENTELIYITK